MSEKKTSFKSKALFVMIALVGMFVLSLGYYSYPRTDSVSVVSTEVKRITPLFGDETIDQQRVRTTSAKTGEAMVFRNDDAVLFPPYMKWDSEDLQTILDGAAKADGEKSIMCFKHYGFRVRWPVTVFPNVTSAEKGYCPGDGPVTTSKTD